MIKFDIETMTPNELGIRYTSLHNHLAKEKSPSGRKKIAARMQEIKAILNANQEDKWKERLRRHQSYWDSFC